MPSFTAFRPATAIGTLYGAAIVFICLVLGLGLLYRGLTLDVGINQIWPFAAGLFFLGLAALYAYWTLACSSLAYFVDRDALSIRWGNLRQVVPLANIERLIPASA